MAPPDVAPSDPSGAVIGLGREGVPVLSWRTLTSTAPMCSSEPSRPRRQLPAYLESSSERNLALYGRHRFEVTSKVAIPDGPTIWPMWRQPQSCAGDH
jgi:hypothetical protein